MTKLNGVLPESGPPHPENIGPYTIRGVLGRGGMGVVFDAQDKQGGAVALKIVRVAPEMDVNESVRLRFQREARILSELNHPSIIRLHDAGEIDGVLYLAMEKIEGRSLLTLRREGPVDAHQLIEIGIQLADALMHVHNAGVVHRDIKPANVLLRANNQPVLTDFGISGLSRATRITEEMDLLGSPGFMAPEILDGHGPTPASDQFALGRLLFELGALGPSSKLARGVPLMEILRRALQIDWERLPKDHPWPELQPIMSRMLEVNPRRRYPSVERVRQALSELTLGLETSSFAPFTETTAAFSESTSDETEGLLADLDLPAGEQTADTRELPALSAAFLKPAAISEPKEHDDDLRTVLEPLDLHRPQKLSLPSVRGGRSSSKRDRATSPEPPRPATTIPASPPPSVLPPPTQPIIRGPGPMQARIDWLENRVERLKEELEKARATKYPNRRWTDLVAVCIAGVLVGGTAGWMSRPTLPKQIDVLLLPDGPGRIPTPHPSKEVVPTPDELRDARTLYAHAKEQLSHRDFDGAERTLEFCIDTGNLPACHRMLTSLRALTGHPSAHENLQRYLRVSTNSEETDQVQAALKKGRDEVLKRRKTRAPR